MDIWERVKQATVSAKVLRQEQRSRNYKKGTVAEAEEAGNGMMGNKARQVSRSCRILRITVRTSDSILGDPRRH